MNNWWVGDKKEPGLSFMLSKSINVCCNANCSVILNPAHNML